MLTLAPRTQKAELTALFTISYLRRLHANAHSGPEEKPNQNPLQMLKLPRLNSSEVTAAGPGEFAAIYKISTKTFGNLSW